MQFKTAHADWSVKSAPERRVSGVFASFGVDSDNDLTDEHSIAPGQTALVSMWGHRAVDGERPVGTAEVWLDKNAKHYGFNAQYFSTPSGTEAFEIVREGGPLVQWSYALQAKREPATYEGKSCHRLRSVEIIELSPVTRAAGVSTRTLSAKAACRCGCDESSLPPDLAHDMALIRGELIRKEWLDREQLGVIAARMIAEDFTLEQGRYALRDFVERWS